MNKQVLDIVQMQELIDMGIDVSKASMCWFIGATPDLLPIYSPVEYVENEYVPTFTLQDILQMLPNEIDGCTKRISIYPINSKNMGLVYYEDTTTYSEQHELTSLGRLGHVTHKILHGEYDKPLLEVAFNMLKWCKQNNYI